MIRTSRLTPEYGWNEKAARYTDLSTGRFVPRQAVMRELDKVIEYSQARIEDLSGRMVSGELSLPEWQAAMEREIKTVHTAAGAAARGGWAQMSKSDWGFVGSQVKKQYRYFDNFVSDLNSGQMPLNKRVIVRAGLYGQAARGTFEEMRRRMAKVRGKAQERRRLGPAEHCAGCVEQAGRNWQPIGTLPPIGSQECVTNCHCYFEYK
jgi:hypothetical protein